MTLTNKQLVEFVKRKLTVKTSYMWGEFGRKITNSTINQKVTQYRAKKETKDYYKDDRVAHLRSLVGKNYYGCDCTGLYKWFIWSENDKHNPYYKSATDRDTVGMYNAATEKGGIKTIPEIPGLIVYKYGHVGVYIGNSEVVECTLSSFGDGVVKTKLKDRDWTHWLKMPEITYETETTTVQPSKPTTSGKFGVGDTVIISGSLYPSANATKATGKVSNKATKITRYAAGAKHPYNTTGDLGWMNESDIKLVSSTNTNTTTNTTPSASTSKMKVTASTLAMHNSNTRWISKGANSTLIAWIPKGTVITVYPGTEKRLGIYTSIKITYNGKTGYCAKNYLTTV